MPSISVIYEDKDFVALNKPAGVLVHAAPGKEQMANSKERETLVDWILERYPEIRNVGDDPDIRPGIVHRLDKDTSGVIVVARNQSAFDHLKALFQSHKIEKTYLALVYGRIKDARGVIDAPIGLKSGTVRHTTHLAKNVKLAKEARTAYETVGRYDFNGKEFTLLKIRPETGRTHQIRVHLASIGHPVIGDDIYGKLKTKDQKLKTIGLSRQFLHAESVSFTSPSGERLTISADLPEDLERALSQLSPSPSASR